MSGPSDAPERASSCGDGEATLPEHDGPRTPTLGRRTEQRPGNDATDTELLEHWREGSNDAGEALVARHFWAVFGFFRTKVAELAEDMTQQTFLACIESRHRVDPQRGFRGFLFGIARHKLLQHLERMAGPRGRFDPHRSSMAAIGVRPGFVTMREEQRSVLDAMARLPVDLQISLELHYWWGMKVPEIAVATEVAVGTVKSRLSRGRQLLRNQLEALEAPPLLRDVAPSASNQPPDSDTDV